MTPENRRKLEAAASKISTTHRSCEDPWYSCSKSEGGCLADGDVPSDCSCGADEGQEAVNLIREVLDSEPARNPFTDHWKPNQC